MNVINDWKEDLKSLQEKFIYKKKVYTIIENVFFIWILLITSTSEVLKFTSNEEVFLPFTSVVSYLIVISTGIKKYINPEKKKEKFKFAYIDCKVLEDILESEVTSPTKELKTFLDELRQRKMKILEKYL